MASNTVPSLVPPSRRITKTDLGLKTYYPDPAECLKCDVDIVAIHGIGAHPDETWNIKVTEVNPVSYINWLQDEHMLPQVVPRARIMRFGYESNWYADVTESAVSLNPVHIAEILLRSLEKDRENDPLRPLIFVSHCYGGLVVIKALREAYDEGKEWPDIFQATTGRIFQATTGMIFLSTPFRGAPGIDQRSLLAEAARFYGNIRPESLQMLKRNDAHLGEILKKFLQTRKAKPNAAYIHCFYETKSCNVKALVRDNKRQTETVQRAEPEQVLIVDETSGTLDLAEFSNNHALQRTHFDINKFESPDEADYKFVTDTLRKLVIEAREDPRWSSLRCSRLLGTLTEQPQRLLRPEGSYWQHLTVECHILYEEICNEYIRAHNKDLDIHLNELQALCPDLRLCQKLSEVWQRLKTESQAVARNYAMVVLYMAHVELELSVRPPTRELIVGNKTGVERFEQERKSALKRFSTWIPCPCAEDFCGHLWAFPNDLGLCKAKVPPAQCRPCPLYEWFRKGESERNMDGDEKKLFETVEKKWRNSEPESRKLQ